MAGQRTTITLGTVAVEVSLLKVSGDPPAAKWETRTVNATSGEELASGVDVGETLIDGVREATTEAGAPDPLGTMPNLRDSTPIIPQDAEQAAQRDSLAARATTGQSLLTRTERGVHRDDGTWVDLTEQLAEIDERVKLDGIEVVAAIPADVIPRDRVRGASYVTPIDDLGVKVCALLFDALAGDERRALAVRWSKRTNQALGIVVPDARRGALLLLEVEWAASMRDVPPRAVVAPAAATLTDREREAAATYVGALKAPSASLNELEDDRRRLHAALLTSARAGQEFELPTASGAIDEEFAEILTAASA